MAINPVEPPHDDITSMERGVAFTIGDKDYERYQIGPTEVFDTTCKRTIFYGWTVSLVLIHRLGKLTCSHRSGAIDCTVSSIKGKLHGLITRLLF